VNRAFVASPWWPANGAGYEEMGTAKQITFWIKCVVERRASLDAPTVNDPASMTMRWR
jgi:hypothetical protein